MSQTPWDQKLARILVRPLVATPVHPNHLTGLSFVFGLIAAILFAMGGPAMPHVAAGLFMFATFLDHTDGELARQAGKNSSFGKTFDSIVNCSNHTMLFIGIGIGLSAGALGGWALVLGFTAGLCNPIILILRLGLERRHGAKVIAHPGFGGFEIEDFIYLVGPITWVGGLKYFFLAYGFGTFGYVAWTIWEAVRSRQPAAPASES